MPDLEILDNVQRTELRPGDVLELPVGFGIGPETCARLRYIRHAPGEWHATVVQGGKDSRDVPIYLCACDRLQVVRRGDTITEHDKETP